MRLMRWPLILLLPPLFALPMGCELEPEVGPPLTERCSNDDSDPARDTSFARDVQPLILRSAGGCVLCHDPSGSNPLGVELGGLDLRTYESLREGGAQSGASIVVPGRPCESDLYLKLSPSPRFGSRMPFDGPPFFTATELQLVSDWIAEGAKND